MAPWWELDPAGRWGIQPTYPEFAIIQSFATSARQLSDPAFTCPANKPRLAPVFPTQPNCPQG